MLLDVACRERSGAPTNLDRRAVSLLVRMSRPWNAARSFSDSRGAGPIIFLEPRVESMRGVVVFAATGRRMPGWTQNGARRTVWPAAA
jgi:hypothetical protein